MKFQKSYLDNVTIIYNNKVFVWSLLKIYSINFMFVDFVQILFSHYALELLANGIYIKFQSSSTFTLNLFDNNNFKCHYLANCNDEM
ncbi:hypothetical protein DERF_005125 [Dermatophagoides farinae]|uniref:Uncharacterized protein n=1 Tax=Dermatophagoides farinae TaxID=6954 RepID=A0A922I2U5_DERFA|nr:hypothetical protein DERF_005125 [Dermatophagoides farinae]